MRSCRKRGGKTGFDCFILLLRDIYSQQMSKTGSKGKKEKAREEEWIEMEDLKAPQNQNISKKLA